MVEEELFDEIDIEDDDISLIPSHNADAIDEIYKYIDKNVTNSFEVHSYRHAAAILKNSFEKELKEIEDALLNFSIKVSDFATPGGNESIIPKKFSQFLRPLNWFETRIQGDLVVSLMEHTESFPQDGKAKKVSLPGKEPIRINQYIDGHKIDYVKGRVALDLEWNSKDQTFDRDLYAFRMFHECGIISVAVIITRSALLNDVFNRIPLLDKNGNIAKDSSGNTKLCKQKFGASTTWMGKLLYRLNAGRHGGCPVLVIGITPRVISDLEDCLRNLK